MSRHCEDCGCRTDHGICSNCHEELAILTFQGDCISEPLSQEFIEKAREQETVVRAINRKVDHAKN